MTSTGMTTITVSSCPRTNTPPISHEPENAVGYGRTRVTSGRINWKNSSTCAAPINATSRITRGAEKSRRTISNSSAAPTIAPTAMHATNETQNGAFQSMTSRYSRAAANPPISPIAKLTTRVERNTRITPTAITPYVSPVIAPEKTTCFGKATASIAVNTGQRPRNTARARSSRAASSAVDPVNRI